MELTNSIPEMQFYYCWSYCQGWSSCLYTLEEVGTSIDGDVW